MVKPLHAEDPYELKGVMLEGGEPSIQARIMIEELFDIGTGPEQLINMFNDKFYAGLYLLTVQLGAEFIQDLIMHTAEKMDIHKRISTIVID